jgi:Kef-type K+ transport system membrane component KefB
MDDGARPGLLARVRGLAGYAAMLLAAAAAFLGIRHLGAGLEAPPPTGPLFGRASVPLTADALVHVLLALIVIVIAARAVGAFFGRLGQPAVIGEVVAGIILGPSLLGRVLPEAAAFVLPASIAPTLAVLSQVGIILYMFVVGLELDFRLLKDRTGSTVAISHASIVLPFLLGALLALALYPRVSTSDVPFTHFALFCGVSMAVTAFPVLARILTDRGMQGSRLGVMALTCAAVDDATAWCLLAFVVSVVNARVGGAVMTFGLAVFYVVLMFAVARPAVQAFSRRFEERGATLDRGVLTVVLVAMLGSAVTTELIGIHAVFGAFALGALFPSGSRLTRELTSRLEDVVVVLFLPVFFAYTGLRTQIGLVAGAAEWLLCVAVIVTACAGKFGGTLAAARLTGLGWRDGAALGVLMNTRGLMELVVLNIGLDLRVISPTLFAMLVIMAVVTTMATTPLLHAIEATSERSTVRETSQVFP